MITYFIYLMDELNKPFYCDRFLTDLTDDKELKSLITQRMKRVISLNPKTRYISVERYINDDLCPIYRKDLKTGRWQNIKR